MKNLSDQDLLLFNQWGLFPSSLESEEEFLERIQEIQKKTSDSKVPKSHMHWVFLNLKELFDIEPKFFYAFYSNKSLTPWQGAATWFEKGKFVAIQLRKNFEKGTFLKIYERDEILSHEAVHAARGELKSVFFEEYFAYMSSEKKWRRALGPIVQRPWEVWPFLLFCFLGPLFPIFFLLGSIWLFLGFFRLIRGHWLLKKASRNLDKELKDVRKTRAVLVRLTDAEILKLSKGFSFFEMAKKKKCLRWKAISLAYLRK